MKDTEKFFNELLHKSMTPFLNKNASCFRFFSDNVFQDLMQVIKTAIIEAYEVGKNDKT